MKILWICGLPLQVQQEALNGRDYGAHAAWSWILGHLPPPGKVVLHIACPCVKILKPMAFEYQGVQFHLVPCLPGRLQFGFLLDPLFFKPLVRTLNPDVVHGWGTEDSFSIIAQSLAPRKCVVQIQGLINAYLDYLPSSMKIKYIALRERQTLKRAGTVYVESRFSAEITGPYCGRNTNIIQVDHPLRSAFLETVSVSGLESGILFIGSLCDRKGYQDAIQAFSLVANPDWKLRVVGSGGDTENKKIKQLIARAPNSQNITHIPHASSDDIVDLMKQSSLFLLPSKMDTGPTALKEALAMGLWPVCYDNSGPREYINRFNHGSLAKTDDVEDLARVLGRALDEKPWRDADRLSSAVDKVRHDLCAATIWEQLLEHYQEIIKAAGN